MTTPRIYVASLADYNAGRLHGAWIDITSKDTSEILADIQKMLGASREHVAEDWAIHDVEGFGKWNVSEYANITHLAMFGQAIDALDEDRAEPFAYWWSRVLMEGRFEVLDFEDNIDGLIETFREEYQGNWSDVKTYLLESERGDMFIGLDTLKQAAEYGTSHMYDRRKETEEAIESAVMSIINYVDWDHVAQNWQMETDGVDVEKAPELGGGYWIFEDQH